MDVREKLVELLERAFESFIDDPYCIPDEREFADHLIANGVTFATDNNVGHKWISVKDRLPGGMDWVLCACVNGEVHILCYDYIMDDWDIHHRPNSCYGKEFVTHWMPLPQPPKGE